MVISLTEGDRWVYLWIETVSFW